MTLTYQFGRFELRPATRQLLKRIDTRTVVIGIGMNVGAAPPDQPFATSLAAEGACVERHAVLVALLTNLAEREAQWREGRGDPERTRLRADYRAACASLGSEVRVLPPASITISTRSPLMSCLLREGTGRRRSTTDSTSGLGRGFLEKGS